MATLFGGPSVPAPPPPPPAPPTMASPSIMEAGAAGRRQMSAEGALEGTNPTGGQGVKNEDTTKKALLGG